MTEKSKSEGQDFVKVLTTPQQEKPILEIPPRMRLGTLIRRARIRAKKSLQEMADVLSEDGFTPVVLGEVERGKRPVSWDQVDSICHYLDVNPEIFHQALMQFHHEIWSGQKVAKVVLEEQIEKVTSLPLNYDTVELVSALRNAISSMDIGKGALERASRIIRHSSCGGPFEFVRDAEMAAQASVLLDSSMHIAQVILENPPEAVPVPKECDEICRTGKVEKPAWEPPEDWQDAAVFEISKVYQLKETGDLMRIIGEAETLFYGHVFVAETQNGIKPVVVRPGCAENWREVPLSQWYKNWLSEDPVSNSDFELYAKYEVALREEGEEIVRREVVSEIVNAGAKRFTPRIVLDFDGVIHSYKSGWAGDACVIPDPPVPGAFEFITEAIDRGYDVSIFSTRSHELGACEAMRQWLLDNGMEQKIVNLVRFPKKKPSAILLIDDRGYHFKGTFPSFEYIDEFKPWNKGGERDDDENI